MMRLPSARDLTIANKLRLAFLALMALMLCMSALGVWRLSEMSGVARQMAATNLRMERLVGEWLSLTSANAVRATALAHADDTGLQTVLAPEMGTTTARINELAAQVQKLADDERARALFQAVTDRRQEYIAIRRGILEQRKAGMREEAKAAIEANMLPASRRYVDSIKTMADHYSDEVARDAATAIASAERGRNLLIGLAVAGLLLSLVCGRAIIRSITDPIGGAVEAARRVADGDLGATPQSGQRDEMGQLLGALSDMTHRLRELVGEVAGGARAVADTSAQIAAGNLDLSQRTEEQASTLEETASSMEELTSTVAQNAENARQASQLALGATDVARKGGQVMGQVAANMAGISQSSTRIAEITSVIDGIAFQTNILALNAAVEAARAGEQGRGFAVVASEVRVLAQRSAAAAKEIKSLIDDSAGRVGQGIHLVSDAGRTMEEIVAAVVKVSGLVAEIAAASREQSTGIGQVNTAVSQMEQVVQQNASLVEEAAAAADSMKAQADALLTSVSRFKLPADAAGAPLAPGKGRIEVAMQLASLARRQPALAEGTRPPGKAPAVNEAGWQAF